MCGPRTVEPMGELFEVDTDADLTATIRGLLVRGLDLGYLGEELTADLPLLSSDLVDSYGLQELASFFESEFGITVDDRDLRPANFETIRDMARFVSAARGG